MPRRLPTQAPDFQARYGVLLDIGRILTGTLEPAQLYRTIYEQASRVLETTGFYISLYDAELDLGTVVFVADRGKIERPGITYPGSRSRAITEARPVLEQVTEPGQGIMLIGSEQDEEVTRSVMAAPMLHKGQVLGVISAQSYRSAAYSEADLELLMAIADLAAVAVSNARAMEELARQRQESQQLEEIGRALAASLDLDEVLQRIVAATRELVAADGAGVWLLRPDMTAEVAMTAGDTALPVGTVMRVPPELYELFRRGREPFVMDRRRPSATVPREILDLLQAESGIGVPLIAEDELIGALSVSHLEARSYAPRDVRLLERLAFHAAIAVANARLHEQVRLLSLTDPLTDLPNRRHMGMFLDKEFAAAERGRSLAVVLFDLDDFKVYNDTAGHQAGDIVLRRFGEILEGQTRAMNLAARYGGDEFILILSDADTVSTEMIVRRVIDAVAADDVMSGVGVSAGVAVYEAGVDSADELIRRADEAMYRVKAGRDREISDA